MYGGVHVIHSHVCEILIDIQNDIFGDYFVDLLWCCHNETQTCHGARNNFFIVVLGAQMCMHYMKFVGVYHIDPSTVWFGCLISLKTKLKISSSIGIQTWDRLVTALQRNHLRHRSD